MIRDVLRLSGQSVEGLAAELDDVSAEDLHDAKMRALYVDIESGAIATPRRVADHAGAQERGRALRREVHVYAMLLGGAEDEES